MLMTYSSHAPLSTTTTTATACLMPKSLWLMSVTNKRNPLTQFIPSFLFVPMPTHCTIMRFGFHARQIDGVECGIFFNHALLGQTTLYVGRVSV